MKKTLYFFDDLFIEPKQPRKYSPSVRVRHRNRSGVVDLVGREPLMFTRVENGVTKFSPKKQKTPKFWIRNSSFQWGIFIFLAAEKPTFGHCDCDCRYRIIVYSYCDVVVNADANRNS